MKVVFLRTCLTVFLSLVSINSSANLIKPGMMDDFEDGTTRSWVKGPKASSGQSPKNLSLMDESNRYLQVESYGAGEKDRDVASRLVFFNEKQWAGDYSEIGAISMKLKAESATEEFLFMRLAFYDDKASGSYTRFVSRNPFVLSTDGKWHDALFNLEEDDFSRFRGERDWSDVLQNVTQLRILSNKDEARAWGVDKIAASLSVDDITALPKTSITTVPLPSGLILLLSALYGLFAARPGRKLIK